MDKVIDVDIIEDERDKSEKKDLYPRRFFMMNLLKK